MGIKAQMGPCEIPGALKDRWEVVPGASDWLANETWIQLEPVMGRPKGSGLLENLELIGNRGSYR